jgi:hypothetical protein
MDLLLLVVLILVVFALAGGVWLNPLIFLVLIVALLVFLLAGRGRVL